MIWPENFLKFTIEKNNQSQYWEDPNYIASGNVTHVEILSFKPYQIEVQLEFSNPLFISLDQMHRDILKVEIIDNSTFTSAIDFITNPVLHSSAWIEIFRQMSKESSQKVQSLAKNQQAINTLLTSSLPINLLLGLSLKYLWGMINTLQYIIFMDEWTVNWPPNA